MIREYIQDNRRAKKISLNDPILQQIIRYKAWAMLPDKEIQQQMGLSDREWRVYRKAYRNYVAYICF